jgi:ribosomal protein S18 acetylase RimI-like enzyme
MRQMANDHQLDSPLWYALGGSLAQFCHSVGEVRILAPDIGHVAAMQEVTPANTLALASALPDGDEILVIAPAPVLQTALLDLVSTKPLLQMVAQNLAPVEAGVQVQELTAAHFPQMLALVDMTHPGPLGPRAMELGRFHGIFDGDALVALAGERLHLDDYTEVSTVCTHPDHRGRSYAKAVVSAVAQGIVSRGQTPFLGVNADNFAAIKLYECLGFTHTRTLYLNTVKRIGPAIAAATVASG